MPALNDAALAQIFNEARTQNGWLDTPVSDDELRALYNTLKHGPTSLNCQPARYVFIRTPEAKERLKPLLMEGNREKAMAAPVNVIIGMDLHFFEHLPRFFPFMDARPWFSSNAAFARETALRNGSLQGAYLMIAARALGLDVGGMSGFDAAGVSAEFFPGGTVEANFICNLGHGDASKLYPVLPRFEFDEICRLA